jgi:hypothetical protein
MGRKGGKRFAPRSAGCPPCKLGRPFAPVAKKVAKKGDRFHGFGKPVPFNQNDDDQVDAGEPNAPAAENPNDDANKVSDDDDSDDVSFVQVASKKVAKKGDGPSPLARAMAHRWPSPLPFPFHQPPDDWKASNFQPDWLPVTDWLPVPFNQNDDDPVDAGEPNALAVENPHDRTCRSLNGCGKIFCFSCYP